jgi:hypothetical protein
VSSLRAEHLERLACLLASVPRNELGPLLCQAFHDPYEPADAFFDRLKNSPDEIIISSLEYGLRRVLTDHKR